MEFMDMSFNTVTYFKDYGETQSVTTTMEIMETSTTTRVITTKTHIYILNLENKTGKKNPIENYVEMEDLRNIDYENISKEMKEKYNIEEIGKERVAGKKCKIITVGEDDAKSKFWIWQNINLKYEVMSNGTLMKMTAKSIDKKPSFPAGIFEVPSDFTIE